MKNRYSVLVVGMGKRGMHHALAFNANPRFQVTGICDIDRARLDAAAAKLGNPQQGADAGALAKAVKPDVFCFTTLPNLRTPMIKAGIESGAKLLAFEKPVALTSAEMFGIRDLIERAGVKAVVSHQHRYGAHYRKVREIIGSGALGRVHTVYGSATGWMTHMLSHLVDYTCWFNHYTPATWVMAQAAGRRQAWRQPSFARLHRRVRAVRQRRARHLRMRRGRARPAGGGEVVGQEPHWRAGHRRFRRSAHQRRLARGHAGPAVSRAGKER